MEITVDLDKLADQIMQEKGLEPEFSDEALKQASQINAPIPFSSKYVDLRTLLWCSIDNEDSRDLDQLTYAEKNKDNTTTIWVAIAVVDTLVPKDSPIDNHAQINTTSVYTPTKIFPMLPEKLSTQFTSLNENEDRAALVIKIQINQLGEIINSSVFQAFVHNYAKLVYESLGGWLAGTNAIPEKVKNRSELEKILKTQHEAAQILRMKRHRDGSLTLEPAKEEVKILNHEKIVFQPTFHNLAHQLIEEFMIAANKVMARQFGDEKIAGLRRVVRTPKNWNRIVEIAKTYGEELSEEPDAKALDAFLLTRQQKDPEGFPELSLTIIKLLGRGEYVVERNQESPVGHFALALTDYTHFTAPNRRFPDLISQRQYNAFLKGRKIPIH